MNLWSSFGEGKVGLGAVTGIYRGEAIDFIVRYLTAYPEIHEYLEGIKSFAAKHGFVETYFGRRRYLPEINSGMAQVRAAAERAAINHPIQGTAADLMKLAMISIAKKLPKISKDSMMIMQVHDELVFEVPNADVKKVAKLVEKEMEAVYKLTAPVETHIEVGQNWGEMKKIS